MTAGVSLLCDPPVFCKQETGAYESYLSHTRITTCGCSRPRQTQHHREPRRHEGHRNHYRRWSPLSASETSQLTTSQGFKSYAVRTVVSGWCVNNPSNNERVHVASTDHYRDESFNSITGLNGSGKSNILDSICFVLGITNMSTVRAQNLQVSSIPEPLSCGCRRTMFIF